MVILNILGKIEKTYISNKLGLYISNLPDGGETNWNNWQEGIKETLQIAYETEKLYASQFIGKFGSGPNNIFETRVHERAKSILNKNEEAEEIIIEEYIDYLSKNMICIDIDYQNCEIPYGENVYSCFDWGSCEDEPVEKILEFLGFVARGIENKGTIFPYCVYSTNQKRDREYRFIFSGTTDIDEPITELKKWGNQLDKFLLSEREFYQLDYLCNALFDLEVGGKNTYQYMKLYSLCALFLEKEKEIELDYKLPYLMDASIPVSDREGMAELMRKIRNKIAHGDFEKLNELLECYAQKYMDGKFGFDYSEYTRSSWVLLHISCKLEEILLSLISLMLKDNSKVVELRNMKQPQYKNANLVSYDIYIKRLLEIQKDCNREQYLAEVMIPVLKMCCLEGQKIIPVYDDRATGRKTENETECKRRMKTICALKEDGGYVVPDYIFVEQDYSYDNPKKPVLMIETKNPIIINGERYRKLEDSIANYESELYEEIKACGCLIYTDGITWMFLEIEDDKIIESKKYKKVCLINLHEKINKVYSFSTLSVTTEWKQLLHNIRLLLENLCNKE